MGAGTGALPAIPPGLQSRAAARLAPQDRAILAMRLAGTSTSDMAAAVGLRTSALQTRLSAIVAVLGGPPEPLPGGPLRAAA